MEARAHRPVIISIISILAFIQAIIGILFGIGLIVERNDSRLLAHVSQTSNELTGIGVGVLIVAVITLFVAIGLWQGSNVARFFLGFVELLHLAGGIYLLFAHEGTGRWDGVTQIVIACLILYFLFNARSERFFESRVA